MSNLALQAELNRVDKKWGNPLSSYTQSNCQCTLTNNGYRIYRTPNVNPTDNGSTMWGGLVLRFYTPPFIKGHRYIICFEVRGQNSDNSFDIGWSNNCGWGGGGLSPSPSNIVINNIGNNYNSQEWFPFSYVWTINDDVYKTCTSSYSSFTQGTVYPSYRDFKYGFGYTNTGSLGTDLYIKNIRMFDITTSEGIDLSQQGILKTSYVNEAMSNRNIQWYPSGEVMANDFYEL